MSVLRPARRSPAAGAALAGLMLALLLVFASASHDPVSANNETQQDGHHKGVSKKVFPVLSFNYDYVRTPMEILIWILLALLMKLGE